MDKGKYPHSFEQLKRDFEIAYLANDDYTDLLYALAKAIVSSCANKCMQVDAAHQADYLDLKTQIEADYQMSLSQNITESGSFHDGIDLIQEAVCLLLEQAAIHGTDVGWLDKPYTTRKIASRSRIKELDTAGYHEEETTPIQECYRAVRRIINSYQQSHNSCDSVSLDSLESSQLDTIYRQCSQYLDSGNALRATKWDYEDLLHALNLTERQERILTLRIQGYGYQAIATYLGVSKSTVTRTLDRLKDKCMAMGFTP